METRIFGRDLVEMYVEKYSLSNKGKNQIGVFGIDEVTVVIKKLNEENERLRKELEDALAESCKYFDCSYREALKRE